MQTRARSLSRLIPWGFAVGFVRANPTPPRHSVQH
jgi:hypothetical protein